MRLRERMAVRNNLESRYPAHLKSSLTPSAAIKSRCGQINKQMSPTCGGQRSPLSGLKTRWSMGMVKCQLDLPIRSLPFRGEDIREEEEGEKRPKKKKEKKKRERTRKEKKKQERKNFGWRQNEGNKGRRERLRDGDKQEERKNEIKIEKKQGEQFMKIMHKERSQKKI